MNNLVSAGRYSILFAFFGFLLTQHGIVKAYSPGEAGQQLGAAATQLALGNCKGADDLLDKADVSIDQVLRDRTMKGCLTQPLNDLRALSATLAALSRNLENICGMRRSYDNTLVKVDSWANTPLCGPSNKNSLCTQYARTAVRQNQLNERKKCGFTGNRWTNDYNGHYNWCMAVAENTSHQETQARKVFLDNCAVPGACNRFIGTWDWFTGEKVTISSDYRFSTQGKRGTWRCLSDGRIEMRWTPGGYIDTLAISGNGNSIRGTNQYGVNVTGTKKSTARDCPGGYNPYGCN